MDELGGKVAVVTGGASGIGFAMAERFATEGMNVVVADIEEGALDAAVKTLAEHGADVIGVPTDVADAPSVSALADAALERFGAIHVVCNNAGVGGHGFTSWESGPDWQWVLGVNLWGVVHGVQTFVPILLAQNEGHIVNTASVAGLMSVPMMAPYAASKHAVLALSEALFHELSFKGSAVKVSVVCPGFVRTNIADSQRNWPAQLGPAPGIDGDDPIRQGMQQMFRGMIAGGVEPAALAEAVVDAIRTGRFMVLNDPDLARATLAFREVEIDGGDPQMPSLS